MVKEITRIVLTGGPAAGKTTLISRILKEFKSEDGWKVITIPETATELISGFGIIQDQLHKESLALKAAQMVPEKKVLIIYDRAVMDDKAYVSDSQFKNILLLTFLEIVFSSIQSYRPPTCLSNICCPFSLVSHDLYVNYPYETALFANPA